MPGGRRAPNPRGRGSMNMDYAFKNYDEPKKYGGPNVTFGRDAIGNADEAILEEFKEKKAAAAAAVKGDTNAKIPTAVSTRRSQPAANPLIYRGTTRPGTVTRLNPPMKRRRAQYDDSDSEKIPTGQKQEVKTSKSTAMEEIRRKLADAQKEKWHHKLEAARHMVKAHEAERRIVELENKLGGLNKPLDNQTRTPLKENKAVRREKALAKGREPGPSKPAAPKRREQGEECLEQGEERLTNLKAIDPLADARRDNLENAYRSLIGHPNPFKNILEGEELAEL